jgi:hypothetical protein
MAKCGMTLGDVTTLNLTMLKAGVTTDGQTFQMNVIPTEAEAGFDIRIPPSGTPPYSMLLTVVIQLIWRSSRNNLTNGHLNQG